ncbi:MAG: CopD family protein [Pararhodobacter sp.]|nr:CopD family protein [Pararhodobacter sp.]
MIALTKALHIAALSIWCAGLIALPVILQFYGRSAKVHDQAGFAEFRLLSHRAYTGVITPAAIVAISAGTALIFMEGLRTPWLMAKLGTVAGMVLIHAWMGYLIGKTGEGAGRYRVPTPLPAMVLALALMGVTLWLVLAKPDLAPLADHLPDWLLQPRGRELAPALVPI